MRPQIAQVAVPRQVDRLFDYLVPEHWGGRELIGSRVRVRFGSDKLEGVIVGLKGRSDFPGRLRELEKLLDERPLWTERELELARWIADYYLCPLGLVLASLVPAGVRTSPLWQ